MIGKYTSVTQDKDILLDWRFRNWQESDVSKVPLCTWKFPTAPVKLRKCNKIGIATDQASDCSTSV